MCSRKKSLNSKNFLAFTFYCFCIGKALATIPLHTFKGIFLRYYLSQLLVAVGNNIWMDTCNYCCQGKDRGNLQVITEKKLPSLHPPFFPLRKPLKGAETFCVYLCLYLSMIYVREFKLITQDIFVRGKNQPYKNTRFIMYI